MSEQWFRDAIVYVLDVATYCDGDENGIGDFRGLISTLPYIDELGVTCLWLLPFYPSPDLDDGYAVTNYYGVDNGLGNLDDFREFVNKAHDYGIRVIVDLVVNHTSNEHHWFQDALNDPGSIYRHYYVWSHEKPEEMAPMIIFPGEQEANWTYNDVAKAYYWHFYHYFQPDLNHANPQVRRQVEEIIEFWLKFGVDGFRIDSLPLMIMEKGKPEAKPKHPHEVLQHMASFAKMYNPEAILLAEANVEPERLPPFFGDGNEMDSLFNFLVNSYFFLALARKDAETLRQAWHQHADVLATGHWVNFMRTHDELSVERLTEAEQQEVFDAFAPNEDMLIYGRGIRCRMPRILQNDRRRLEMVYSFLFSLPGTPLLIYGEEIGMGDDLSLKGRISVRTPMQWDDSKNGGFSPVDPVRLVRPVIDNGDFSYHKINVAAQQDDPDSLLNWMKKLIQLRKEHPLLATDDYEIWDTKAPRVFGLHFAEQSDQEKVQILILHNFSDEAAQIELDGTDWQVIWSDQRAHDSQTASGTVELAPYGYRWLHKK